MRKAGPLIPPIFLLITLVVIVLAELPSETGLPANCQARLDQYIAHTFPTGITTIHTVQRARKPEHLAKSSGYPVFGDSIYYQTDTGPGGNNNGASMPLPFPPKEVWCILLKQEDVETGAASYAVVFAGLHMDMYSADWMVHEGQRDLSSPGLPESLSLVGCDLGLDQVGPLYANHNG